MDLRTGDILLWKGNRYNDTLMYLIGIKGLHSSLILKGKIFERLSIDGKSKYNVYATIYTNKICTVEKLLNAINKHDLSMYILKRFGKTISSVVTYNAVTDYLNMEKGNNIDVYIACILAFIKKGSKFPGKRLDVCSFFVGQILYRLEIIKCNPYNLLPIDFYKSNFDGNYILLEYTFA